MTPIIQKANLLGPEMKRARITLGTIQAVFRFPKRLQTLKIHSEDGKLIFKGKDKKFKKKIILTGIFSLKKLWHLLIAIVCFPPNIFGAMSEHVFFRYFFQILKLFEDIWLFALSALEHLASRLLRFKDGLLAKFSIFGFWIVIIWIFALMIYWSLRSP